VYGDTSPVDDSFLAGLGVQRIPVPVPFVEAGGPVNVCALLDPDGRWTLFDTGVGTEEGLAALERGATERGVNLDRVSRIVVSHGHFDHSGNAKVLADRTGAQVHVHPADAAKLLGDQRASTVMRTHRAYFLRLGVPGEVLDEVVAAVGQRPRVARDLAPEQLEVLHPGERWRFRHLEATVLHMPGHTPGLVCLHDEEHRLLFADDHLLPLVSPNPLLDLSQGEGDTKFLALIRYLESARAVHALELDCVVPGHGEPFVGHRALLDGLFEFYLRRQRRLLTCVEATPLTIYGFLERLYPRRDPLRLLLMISEVLANVEVLEARGSLRRTLRGGAWLFERSAPGQGPQLGGSDEAQPLR